MADCQHKILKRMTGGQVTLPLGAFLFGCTGCKETLVAALSGTVEAVYVARAAISAEVQPEGAPAVPDHDAILARAVRAWESAGLNFGTWANMLSTGSVSEAIFTRQASSLGFQLGDVEQLLAALRSEPESPATE
jgi:1,6-anhydro-N-acetylmuramate kinase